MLLDYVGYVVMQVKKLQCSVNGSMASQYTCTRGSCTCVWDVDFSCVATGRSPKVSVISIVRAGPESLE